MEIESENRKGEWREKNKTRTRENNAEGRKERIESN